MSNLEGPENWENRFKETFYDNGKKPVTEKEKCFEMALTWFKTYSPLNKNYEKPQQFPHEK